MAVIKFDTLVQNLTKAASNTKAAAGDTPSVKDPAEKGTVAVPIDPNATPAAQNMLPGGTNADITPVTTVSVARTVETKAASPNALTSKAAGVAAAINNLRASFGKSATASAITPTLPSDAKNDNKNSTPTAAATNGPAKKQNPDPEAAKTAADAAAKTAADAAAKTPGGTPSDTDAKKAPAPAQDKLGELPPKKENADETGGANKSAGDLQFDPAFHFKIASSLLATEEGMAYAQRLIEAEHGAAEADSIIKAAAFMEQQYNELQSAEDEGAKVAAQLWDAASPEEQAATIKMANAHFMARESLGSELEKQAYDDGAATAATMQDAGALQAPPAGAAPAGPDAGAAAPGADAGAAGAAPGGDPSQGGGEVSDEDIVAVLEQLVQSGEVKPEEAQAIMQALMGGGAGAEGGAGAAPGGEAGAPPADAGAGAGGPPMPPEEAGPDAKAAYLLVKSASAITDQLLAASKPAAAATK